MIQSWLQLFRAAGSLMCATHAHCFCRPSETFCFVFWVVWFLKRKGCWGGLINALGTLTTASGSCLNLMANKAALSAKTSTLPKKQLHLKGRKGGALLPKNITHEPWSWFFVLCSTRQERGRLQQGQICLAAKRCWLSACWGEFLG